MTTQIEQLIETRRTLKSQTSNPVSETYIDMFIRDLQSLQPTEEKTTVTTVLAYEQWYKEALSDVVSILKKEKCVWIPYRNWVERWIEIAEELLSI